MNAFDPSAYGPTIAALLLPPRLAPLGPGQPNLAARPLLEAVVTDPDAFGRPALDRAMADACRAGLWLHHDFLDESHHISQELHTLEGSYWHALMHRREPDFANSKYWFRKVGEHPVHGPLGEAAGKFSAGRMGPTLRVRELKWDAAAFVDLCEEQYDPSMMAHDFCRRLQRLEWELLFDWCYRRAFAV